MEQSKTIDSPGERPLIAITMGDVAGIGPELLVQAWSDPRLFQHCRPFVIGSGDVLRREAARAGRLLRVKPFDPLAPTETAPDEIPLVEGSSVAVADLQPGRVHASAGRAAYDYLTLAIDLASRKAIDAIVTMPLNKEGLHAAGLHYPGHTEILAEKTGVSNFAMMLYRRGLGVVHVTLHMALRDAINALSTERILDNIGLIDGMMRRLGVDKPRIAVAALNPHGSDGGIFGNEEATIISPAVETARGRGIDVAGPFPTDTLFVRAKEGEFDGVVAMYHDQGHIALKLLGWREAVNITVGLPIVRTSVAHGTGYDIVGKGLADPTSLYEAVLVAAKLSAGQRREGQPA